MGTRKMEAQLRGFRLNWNSKRCSSCAWSDKQVHSCDYMLRTGKPRLLICPPGDACTVYEKAQPGEGYNRCEVLLPGSGRPLGFDERSARCLYDMGLNDAKIAQRLDVSRQAIQRWRQTRGLPSHVPSSHEGFRTFREEEARALHANGLTDGEIAEKLGVHRRTITHWRHRRELPCNFERGKAKSGRPQRAAPTGAEEDGRSPTASRSPLSQRGPGAGEGADSPLSQRGPEKGAEEGGAKKRGRKRAIPDERALELYRQGLSDKRIARLIGASDVGVLHWRRRNGLPPNFPSGNGKERDGEGRE